MLLRRVLVVGYRKLRRVVLRAHPRESVFLALELAADCVLERRPRQIDVLLRVVGQDSLDGALLEVVWQLRGRQLGVDVDVGIAELALQELTEGGHLCLHRLLELLRRRLQVLGVRDGPIAVRERVAAVPLPLDEQLRLARVHGHNVLVVLDARVFAGLHVLAGEAHAHVVLLVARRVVQRVLRPVFRREEEQLLLVLRQVFALCLQPRRHRRLLQSRRVEHRRFVVFHGDGAEFLQPLRLCTLRQQLGRGVLCELQKGQEGLFRLKLLPQVEHPRRRRLLVSAQGRLDLAGHRRFASAALLRTPLVVPHHHSAHSRLLAHFGLNRGECKVHHLEHTLSPPSRVSPTSRPPPPPTVFQVVAQQAFVSSVTSVYEVRFRTTEVERR